MNEEDATHYTLNTHTHTHTHTYVNTHSWYIWQCKKTFETLDLRTQNQPHNQLAVNFTLYTSIEL